MRKSLVIIPLICVISLSTASISIFSYQEKESSDIGSTLVSSGRIIPDQASSGQGFRIAITSVGTSPFMKDRIQPVGINVYDIVSDLVFVPVTIKLDVLGWTSLNLGNQTIPGIADQVDFGSVSKTAGQLIIQVDDFVDVITSPSMSDWGFTVPLSKGDHTISLLYIGFEGSNFVFDSDSIIVRIRSHLEEIDPYKTHAMKLNLGVTDVFEQNIFSQEIITSFVDQFFSFNYYLEEKIQPTSQSILSLSEDPSTQNQINDNSSIAIRLDQIDNIEFTQSGIVNSTGFSGLQILRSWETTQGKVFLVDSEGIHPIENLDIVYVREGLNYIGLLVLAPYGMWHEGILCYDDSPCQGETPHFQVVDWEGWHSGIIPRARAIDNLLFASAWTFPGGGFSTVMTSGYIAAQSALKKLK